MKYFVFLMILGLSTTSFAFGGRCRTCVPHQNVVVVQRPTVITQTKIIVPARIETYSEVSGLRLLQDLQGQKFVEVNGRIISLPSQVTEITKEILEKNRIIIDQTITQTF